MYDIYQKRITECDQRLQAQLASLTHPLPVQPPTQKAKTKTKKPAAKNAPRFDLSSELQRVTGVDLTRIDGIDAMVAQTLLSEVGLDMSRWKTESHFASWLEGYAQITASVETRCWAEARAVWSTVPLPPCDRLPTP